ncbi:Glycogen synthase [Methyloligella halotolerans]|uniref:Glycogen synthase n=1 Tax=Methyloligella halotolerans TaxID=1177755 RepID=A0A1E2S2E0_9HYPH|nr:glycosyltransferase family 4 protein [Methyloligella halotolerans]ODA68560.1 Glycogen synthase [Methyloligella halotolerans]
MSRPLRVLHCLRAPVGGLFRHVRDLIRAQAEMGLDVGVVCDSRGGGETAEEILAGLDDHCALGVRRIPMSRQPGLGDWLATRRVREIAGETEPDILHGHGAKGGAYARLAARALKRKGVRIFAFYTPHGGSLHFDPGRFAGKVYIAAERRLAPLTDGLLFESQYAKRIYEARIGPVPCPSKVVPNGLYLREFYDPAIDENAADFLFVGELRDLKGVDVFIEALARLKTEHGMKDVRAVIVGVGPHEARFKSLVKRRKLSAQVSFPGPMPARVAFARGRCVVVPSRAESFPYIVLETIAAGMPLIATDVGGIPEMISGIPIPLVPPDDVEALAGQMRLFMTDSRPFLERSAALQAIAEQRFTVLGMAEDVVAFYFDILERGAGPNA